VAEIRKLVWQVVWAVQPLVAAVFAWSVWRRQHQAVARTCHSQRRVRLLAPEVQL
jgi:hypothetical protein